MKKRMNSTFISFYCHSQKSRTVLVFRPQLDVTPVSIFSSAHHVRERDVVFPSALRSWPLLPQRAAGGEVAVGRSRLRPRRRGTIRLRSARSGWELLFPPGASVSDGEKKQQKAASQRVLLRFPDACVSVFFLFLFF